MGRTRRTDSQLKSSESKVTPMERLVGPFQRRCQQDLGSAQHRIEFDIFIRVMRTGAAWSEQQRRNSEVAMYQPSIARVRRGGDLRLPPEHRGCTFGHAASPGMIGGQF